MSGGRIVQASLEAVVERSDLVELVRTHTELTKRGAEHLGRCPFHDEKTPSFWVNDVKGVYHCFGCGASGDVIDFVREKQGLDFVEAIEYLAARYNVEVEYEERGSRRAPSGPSRSRLHELLGLTAAFYESYLWQASEAEPARTYLAGRNIHVETSHAFRLGYSPTAADGLSKRAAVKGFTREELQEVRLITTGGRDFFRGRLMIPIVDRAGRVIGFGARKLREEQFGGKYMNSGSSRVFNKSHAIYMGPDTRAAAQEAGHVFVVEGYMDVIALHQAGVRNVAAVMGTAFPEQQVTELKRLASRAFVAFDADAAGEAATLRALAQAQRATLDVRVVVMPAGEDPADVVSGGGGVERWRELVGRAAPLLHYRIDALLKASDLDSAPGRNAAYELGMRVFATLPPSPERSEEIARFADRLQLDSRLRTELEGAGRSATPGRAPVTRQQRVMPALVRIERLFLAAASRASSAPATIAALGVSERHFSVDVHRRAWKLLADGHTDAPRDDRELVELWAELQALATTEFALGEATPEPALRSYALRLEQAVVARALGELKQGLARDLTTDQMREILALEADRARIEQQLRELPMAQVSSVS